MPTFDRRNRRELDQPIEEFITTGKINRRQFLQQATAASLSLSAASSLLVACGKSSANTPTKVTSIDVLTGWNGEELASFNAINAAFTQKTGIKVNVETARDTLAVLIRRLRDNDPPAISTMPSLSSFQQLARQGKLVQLDKFFNMSQFQRDYAPTWINFGSVNEHLYAVFPKANTKSTIWYSPKQFQTLGLSIPQSWNDLISLSDEISSSGKYPWAMGVAKSGWPAADWVDQIYLNLSGPDLYDKWVTHQIPWTDPSIKTAIQMFGQIVHGTHYINGAPQAILATNPQDASYLPFENPPKAYLYYLGDFTEGFITSQFPGIKAGIDYNFFPFPTINPQYKGAVTGGVDIMTALVDNAGTRQFMQFMASAEAQSIWVKRGGATSVNKAVNLNNYPNPVARASAQQLTQVTTFRVGADDLMPPAMEYAYWKGLLTYISSPSQLDSVLSSLESTAQQVYES